jgi:hypothetical protein
MLNIKNITLLLCIIVTFAAGSAFAAAQTIVPKSPDLKVSIALLTGLAESSQTGPLIDIIKKLDELYPGKIDISVAPFSRSLLNVYYGADDIHFPMLNMNQITASNKTDPELVAGVKYSDMYFSNEPVFYPQFVLITRAGSQSHNRVFGIAPDMYTDLAHQALFPNIQNTSTCVRCSIEMVSRGRIKGFIFAEIESRTVINENNLTNLVITPLLTNTASFVSKNTQEGLAKVAVMESLVRQLKNKHPHFIDMTLDQ